MQKLWLKQKIQHLRRFPVFWCGAATAIFYLWLVSIFSLHLYANAAHDDGLFLRLASTLARAKWLGQYDEYILIKGLGYPAFVALVYRLGLPLLLAQHLLYLFACALFCYAVRGLLKRPSLRLLLFLALLFSPVTWLIQRVIRDHFYMSLTLLLLACLAGALCTLHTAVRQFAAWTTGVGLSLAVLWHTREEGLWLVPLWLCWALCASVLVWPQARAERWRRLRLLFLTPLFPLAAGLLIATLNFAVYGVFTTTELSGGAFAAAYGATMRVKHQQPERYVPLPTETRERIYRASPAFAELREFFEGQRGQGWKAYCFPGVTSCGKDILAAWYLFAFREAVSQKGYYSSARAARAYYERVAQEVNTACENGTLDCGPPRQTLTPTIPAEHVPYILQSWWRALVFLTRFDLYSPFGAAQSLSICQGRGGLVPIRDSIYPCVDSPNFTYLSGWAISEAGEVELEARTITGQSVEFVNKERMISPDVAAHAEQLGLRVPDAGRARFLVKLEPKTETQLVLKCAGREVAVINPMTGQVLRQEKSVLVQIESASSTILANHQSALAVGFRLRSLDWVQRIYQTTGIWLVCAALLLLPWLCWRLRHKRDKQVLGALAVLCLVAILTRVSLLALIDATSFLAINLYYMAPAYPLVICFCGLTLGCFFEQLNPLRQSSVLPIQEQEAQAKV